MAKAYPPRTGRQSLPDHLLRIEHRHEPASCTCGQCGGNLTKIRDDVTEQLDVEPAKFFVHRHFVPNILAAIVNRCHLPCAVGGLAARSGVPLPRSTLTDWVGQVGVALQPLADRLAWHLLQGDTFHADETPVPQLDPGSGKASAPATSL